MSSVDNSTVTSRLKRKDAEPYKPEESSRFKGRKRTFDESVEYLAYSKPKLPNKDPVRPRKIRQTLSPFRGLTQKRATQRMTKTGPVDSPNNPFVPQLPPKKLGESSTKPEFETDLSPLTPLPETPEQDRKSKSGMAFESRKGMPNRRDNRAPSYNRSHPEELLRFIEDVEKELARANIDGDQDMKEWLRYYADQRSADEWTVLETYPLGHGSFEEFKEELVSHYPEATDSVEGSITRLDKLCAKSKPLTSENLSVMLEFIRGFKFEGRKLLAGGCISNREIVTKFLNCLDPELKRTVVWQVSQLAMKSVSSSTGKEREVTPRHHTDPIEFETLLKVLEGLVRSADSYSTITGSTTGTPTRAVTRTQHTILQRPIEEPTMLSPNDRMVQLLEDLNESMAKNTDVLVNMSKENGQRHGETTKSFETMHTLMNAWHKGEPNKTNSSNQAPPRGCYYCWAVGHYIAHCEFLAADVAEGKVQTQDNGTRMDLRTVPKDPSNLSPKDRVDRQWRSRKQFFAEDITEDSIVDLAPSSLVTLQSNRAIHDKKDDLISDLQEKAR